MGESLETFRMIARDYLSGHVFVLRGLRALRGEIFHMIFE
jgi:hypothetical protein